MLPRYPSRKFILAALFLLCVILLAALAISLFTVPAPRITTQFNLSASGDQILITHTGGESLDCRHFSVLLDEVAVDLQGLGRIECPWSIGEALTIPYAPSGETRVIRIMYDAGKGPQELLVAEIPGRIEEPGTLPTPTVHPTTIPQTPPPSPTTTPGILVASFNATPRSGPVPLAVQFSDTSSGVPDEWSWSFGDGATSTLQNPLHTYMEVGRYQVSLMVKNSLGGHTRISQGYISVTPAEERDIFLEASRGAVVSNGGFIEFSVTKPGARIKIGGTTVDLPDGSRVRLALEGPSKGKIAIRDGSISLFIFDRVVLSVDGIERTAGSAQEILVPGYERLISSLNLEVDGGTGSVRILESGLPAPIHPGDSPLHLVSLRPDTAGILTLDCYREERSVFQGAVSSYSVL
ncbi:MAG TPA: PKD domain-containing protein [Methanolinea sp.]|nr:PKD domain-containing protein [Methanolinea sp.]HQK54969.1 PKD domain-containing protein [Methanolinea sp.]